jgi:hypothetical protein
MIIKRACAPARSSYLHGYVVGWGRQWRVDRLLVSFLLLALGRLFAHIFLTVSLFLESHYDSYGG